LKSNRKGRPVIEEENIGSGGREALDGGREGREGREDW